VNDLRGLFDIESITANIEVSTLKKFSFKNQHLAFSKLRFMTVVRLSLTLCASRFFNAMLMSNREVSSILNYFSLF